MIKVENFPNAYKEVYTILQYVDEIDYNNIPENFKKMLKMNMNNDYKFDYNPNIDFENQKILRETKAIFAYIFLHYWGTTEQVAAIREQFRKDIFKEEEKKKLEYGNREIFKKESPINQISDNNVQMIEYKKENIFSKIINKIKKWFSKCINK